MAFFWLHRSPLWRSSLKLITKIPLKFPLQPLRSHPWVTDHINCGKQHLSPLCLPIHQQNSFSSGTVEPKACIQKPAHPSPNYKTRHFANCLLLSLPTILLKCGGVEKPQGIVSLAKRSIWGSKITGKILHIHFTSPQISIRWCWAERF